MVISGIRQAAMCVVIRGLRKASLFGRLQLVTVQTNEAKVSHITNSQVDVEEE
jgi:hypothetical protein